MSPEAPIEVVVQMFQRLGLRHLLFTSQGRLSGVLTKSVRQVVAGDDLYLMLYAL